jgi:hypothetical protein
MAANKPETPRETDPHITSWRGAIPRIEMNIPMPAWTKPPAPSQPSTSDAAAEK